MWIADLQIYTFDLRLCGSVEGDPYLYNTVNSLQGPSLPDARLLIITKPVMEDFIKMTSKYFASPLHIDTVMKRLRHEVGTLSSPTSNGWFTPIWTPTQVVVKRGEFCIKWTVSEWANAYPKISADFLESVDPDKEIRTIKIQETLPTMENGLFQVNDIPLSDLPPLSFQADLDVPTRRDAEKQRIREARLKVALAKLKAERMSQKYFTKYGEAPEEDSESNLSSDSEEMGDYTH